MSLSEFAIIAFQRTGTTVLTSLLNTNPDIFVAREIFHPLEKGLHSFSDFCSSRQQPSAFLLSERQALYGNYIDMLREKTGKTVVGVNIKYSSCHQLNGDWKQLAAPPDLFGLLESRNAGIIHVVRKNLFHTALSLAVASSTGRWHVRQEESYAEKGVIADPIFIYETMRRNEAEVAMFERFTAGYRNILTIAYEEMFDNDAFSKSTVSLIRKFLGVDGEFNLEPEFRKLAPKNWSDAFLNWKDIKKFISNTDYRLMLDLNCFV